MDRIEDEFDKMLDDLNAVNDDFVNNYFEDEKTSKNDILEEIDNLTKEPLETKVKQFSYNDILDRLDKKENLNNVEDILNLIETSKNSDEFFQKIEKINNDK